MVKTKSFYIFAVVVVIFTLTLLTTKEGFSFEIDDQLGLLSTSDPNGNTLTYTDDGIIHSGGESVLFNRDDLGRITSITDPAGNALNYAYNFELELEQATERDEAATNFTYNSRHGLLDIIDPLGRNIVKNIYNNDGRLIAQEDSEGNRKEFSHDLVGRESIVTDRNGNTEFIFYDEVGNVTSIVDALGNTTQFSYDTNRNQLTQTNALGFTQSATYNVRNDQLTQTDELGKTTRFEYNNLGMGQSEYFAYDALGNLVCHWDFNAQATATIATHGCATDNSQTAKHSYDVNNRLVQSDYADGMVETWRYDAEGNRVQATKTEGGITTTWNYSYDALNRLSSETQFTGGSNEVTLSYAYDGNGNRTQLSEMHGTQSKQTPFTFDALNRLKTADTTSYSYDAVGNRAGMNHANGTTVTYAYDSRHRLTELSHRNAANDLIAQYQYTLHPTGKRTAIVELSGRRSDFLFDDLYRLTNESITDAINGNHNVAFSYDAVGNRISETINGIQTVYAYDANDRLTQTGGKMFAHDRNGNTLTQTLDGAVTAYSYNAKNEMVSSSAAGTTTGYRYNTDGIRVSQSEGVTQTLYTMDANRDYAQVITEQMNGVDVVSYLYGDDLISQQRNGNDFTYHYDGLGSTRALSDNTGAVTDTYNYDAFGETLNQTGTTENDYLFTGEQYDVGLDQYYLRARYYDQSVGRFTQMDTWMGNNSDPITLHKYLYGNVDPVNIIDPSGNFGIGGFAAASNIQATLGSFQAQVGFNILDAVISGETPGRADMLLGLAVMGGPAAFKLLSKLSGKFRRVCNLTNSFDEQTVVATENGLVPIAEINIGDKVWAFNEETGEQTLQEVVHLIEGGGDKELVDITLANGESITATTGHLFYVDGEWVDAGELTEWDQLKGLTGEQVSIQSLSYYTDARNVYNLTVNNDHTYFVGESRVLSHNMGRCIPPLKLRSGHIVFGENTKGKIGGFHSILGLQSSGRRIINTGPADFRGVYTATVAIRNPISGKWKTKSSTMFPDAWSESKILIESRSAYLNAVSKGFSGSGRWKGTSASRVEIEGFIDERGLITSAFPKL